jgi:hypothetical protein
MPFLLEAHGGSCNATQLDIVTAAAMAASTYRYSLKSKTVTAWLLKQAATFVPAEFHATSKISPSPRCFRNSVPSFTDQIRTELSIDPEHRYCPQGEKAIE